jgi:hypothetical protein
LNGGGGGGGGSGIKREAFPLSTFSSTLWKRRVLAGSGGLSDVTGATWTLVLDVTFWETTFDTRVTGGGGGGGGTGWSFLVLPFFENKF